MMMIKNLKNITAFCVLSLLLCCCHTASTNIEKEEVKKEASQKVATANTKQAFVSTPEEWWQLLIEGDDTTVHPYKHIVVTDDSIFYFDDMEDDMRSIDNIRTEGDKRIFEFKDEDQTTYSFICQSLNDSESLWSLPAYWNNGETALYTINKSRYKTYNFGIDTIYQYIGIEKVDSKWHGLYEIFKTFYIGDTEPRDSFYRYYRFFIDSTLFVLENRQLHYYDHYALYVFNENENRLQFTQGFNNGMPKDTCVELFFDGEDYYVNLHCFATDIPLQTKISKNKADQDEIRILRDLQKYKYAKKIPHQNGVYLELPFVETEADDD